MMINDDQGVKYYIMLWNHLRILYSTLFRLDARDLHFIQMWASSSELAKGKNMSTNRMDFVPAAELPLQPNF